MQDIKRLLGEKIKFLRNQKNRSQEELWYRSKLHRNYIGFIERAERNISIENVQKIADAFNIEIKELFNFK